MRIVFIGAVEFSRRALEQILEIDAEVVGVCTLEKSTFNADHYDLSGMCTQYSVPRRYVEDINEESILNWINGL